MRNNLTVPEELLRADLMLVSIRTRMILELSACDEDQKKMAIEDMINRKMNDLRLASDFEATR